MDKKTVASNPARHQEQSKVNGRPPRVASLLNFWSPDPDPEPADYKRQDMPEAVLDGKLGEICQQRLSRFPLAYAWGPLLTAAGALIPRAQSPIRTNLYWCSVGETHSGKSHTCESAFQVLGISNHEVLVHGKFGSAEALMEHLQGDGKASALLYVDELKHLLSKAAIDRASFASVLNTTYYSDKQTGGSKGERFTVDCRLSLAGGVVEEEFGDSFGSATTGGLYDRFCFGLCPQPYQHFYRPFRGLTETINPSPVKVRDNVWDESRQWVKDGMSSRVAESGLRVAYVCACVDRKQELCASDLAPAYAFAQYQMRVRIVLTPNPGENPDARCAVLIRNWLRAHDGKWVLRRDLDRGINSFRLGPGVFNRCLRNLAFNQELEFSQDGKQVRLCG